MKAGLLPGAWSCPVQAVAVRQRRETLDQLSFAGDQAHVDALATQIQPNV